MLAAGSVAAAFPRSCSAFKLSCSARIITATWQISATGRRMPVSAADQHQTHPDWRSTLAKLHTSRHSPCAARASKRLAPSPQSAVRKPCRISRTPVTSRPKKQEQAFRTRLQPTPVKLGNQRPHVLRVAVACRVNRTLCIRTPPGTLERGDEFSGPRYRPGLGALDQAVRVYWAARVAQGIDKCDWLSLLAALRQLECRPAAPHHDDLTSPPLWPGLPHPRLVICDVAAPSMYWTSSSSETDHSAIAKTTVSCGV